MVTTQQHLPIHNIRRLNDWSSRVFIFAGNTLQQQKGDQSFPFSQETNFLYLTGINEPDWWCIIERGTSYLVAPSKTESQRTFDGELSADVALAISGATAVLSRKEGLAKLTELAKEGTIASIGPDPHAKYYHSSLNPGPVTLWRKIHRLCPEAEDVRKELAKVRAVKQPYEIEAMRRVATLTNEAFSLVKQQLQGYSFEYEIAADMTAHFLKTGSKGHAYEPIIAGGAHACTLHYNKNAAALPKRGLVLLDVGATDGVYNADVTRTYCIGEPTSREKSVYSAVLAAQQEIIKSIKPGVTFVLYQENADRIMREALASLDLLKTKADFRRYFPHAVSHGLGIDVHESLGGAKAFAPGMILTVEPGIYIPEEGIGVRIEDDILVTEDGSENLTAAAPYSL